MTIPIAKPYIGEEECRAIIKPLQSGWVVQGPYVKEFEDKFAAFTGVRFAAATSSCTTALHLAVAALGLRPGQEVIVPAFTWIATPNVVEFMGAKPVFCDIDLATFNIDVSRIETLITPRTVGLIPVHLFGLCADMEAILAIARRHRLWVVEDAACAFGARLGTRHAGTFGEFGCFSFHPRKAITTGEGGMLTTDREDFAQLVRSLRDHGASMSDLARDTGNASFRLAEYNQLGYNYRMTDMQGALGSAQMDRAEWILSERVRLAAQYDRRLSAVRWLRPPVVPPGATHGYQAYVCMYELERASLAALQPLHGRRNALMACLQEAGIATRQGTHAPVILGYYRDKYGFRPEQFPNAVLADHLSLALPLYAGMDDADVDAVCDKLIEAAGAEREV
jgi:dTDP-4-amino-4,6-dideoxygalactose transaminase